MTAELDAARSMVVRARSLLDAGRPKDALEVLKSAASARPDSCEVFCQMSRAEDMIGNPWGALSAAQVAARCDPGNEWCYRLQALAYIGLQRPKDAVDAATQATHLAPDLSRAHVMLARALEAQKQFQAADAAADRALSLDPNSDGALSVKVLTLMKLRRYADAEPYAHMALKIDPNSSTHWNNLGAVFVHTGRRREAIDPLTRALEINPANALAIRNLKLIGSGKVIGRRNWYAVMIPIVVIGIALQIPVLPWFALLGVAAIGPYRRRTWFTAFSPFARAQIFKSDVGSVPRRVRRRRFAAFATCVVGGLVMALVVASAVPDQGVATILGITSVVAGIVVAFWVVHEMSKLRPPKS